MFKNYHIVIFKDREGGFRKLRMRGWFGVFIFLLVCASAGSAVYFFSYYTEASVLAHKLTDSQKLLRAQSVQILSLTGKVQSLEQDVRRVQQFDSKLRVLLNVDKDSPEETVERREGQDGSTGMVGPLLLSRHRELFMRRLHSLVDDLSDSVRLEEVDQQTLVTLLRSNKDSLLSTPSVWPVLGTLTSGFGWRRSPTSGSGRMHQGLDISNRIGTPIRAPARGAVTFSGPDGAYGISIILDHGNGISTRYSHLSRTSVNVGDYVQRGDFIGYLGNTGRSTGPHLHYEVHVRGVPVNPMRYILN
ncbi:MAG: M23 family metallopeptidase [Desulfovibrio sp.]|nr:M23 family metallopeptidase [Desulfovibrio sp.]